MQGIPESRCFSAADTKNKNGELVNMGAPPINNPETGGLQAQASSSSSINDFKLLKPISRGAFGRVFLCRHNVTHMLYAVKVLDKAEMDLRNQIANVQNEKRIISKPRRRTRATASVASVRRVARRAGREWRQRQGGGVECAALLAEEEISWATGA